MLKGGDGRVPPSAMGLLPTPQQVHLDHHRPSSLPLGIENNMDSEGSSSHSSSLTQDDTLMFQQLAHLRVSGGARREAGRARGFLYLKWVKKFYFIFRWKDEWFVSFSWHCHAASRRSLSLGVGCEFWSACVARGWPARSRTALASAETFRGCFPSFFSCA